MKSSKEMTDSLFDRRDEYMKQQRTRRGLMTAIAGGVGCVALVALVGFGIWGAVNNGMNNPAPTISDMKVIWADSSYMEVTQNGVSTKLENAINSFGKDKVFAILAMPEIDYSFKYQGKTLEELSNALREEVMLPEKLWQLLKSGDFLKYGEALYTTGTPEGEKWDKALYEQQINFFGKDLLEKYIVDGQFLSEKVEQDIEKAEKNNTAQDAYNKAMSAYLEKIASSVNGSMPSQTVPERNAIIIFLTGDAFSEFKADHSEGWIYDLAPKGGNTTQVTVDVMTVNP
jgi:hypothetical protein